MACVFVYKVVGDQYLYWKWLFLWIRSFDLFRHRRIAIVSLPVQISRFQ